MINSASKVRESRVGSNEENSGPWAWYVLVFTGIALTGFFPWLMVSRAYFQRKNKKAGLLSLLVNGVIFILISALLLKGEFVWWWFYVFVYPFDIAWAVAAWFFQRRSFGPAEKRYVLEEWRDWIPSLFIGALIGICAVTAFSILPSFEARTEMVQTFDSLDRETILFDFIRHSLWGLPIGLLLGLWWAGERKRFHVSHLVTFFSALLSFFIFIILFELLFVFLLHGGSSHLWMQDSQANLTLIPPWISGFRNSILSVAEYDATALFAVPLLFGAVYRIRDFWNKVFLIPLAYLCIFPASFLDVQRWKALQMQIVFNISSPDEDQRASAHKWADILLKRYPNHLQWPKIAEAQAIYYYEQKEFKKSKQLYTEIVNRFSHSNQWHWITSRAAQVPASPEFGKEGKTQKLKIPIVDYEAYLTHNWMALLSVIRYWEGPETAESEIKIRLKEVSREHDNIKLKSLVTPADLDDAAHHLGYQVFILPAGLEKAKDLLNAGFPVIHHNYRSFNLVFGFDETRSIMCAYSFSVLSERLRTMIRKEAEEILSTQKEGQGESKDRLFRIAGEVYTEYGFEYWKSDSLRYMGPFMSVVAPEQYADKIADALNFSQETLRKESKGNLQALVGLSFLRQAHPVQAMEWSKSALKNINNPLPGYVAFLAGIQWKNRDRNIRSEILLQSQFPDLAELFEYFDDPDIQKFIKDAGRKFEKDIDTDVIPWFILEAYISMLDKSNQEEFDLIVKIMKKRIKLNPDHSYCTFLANMYDWGEKRPEMLEALKQTVSAEPLDYKSKLKLAFGLVLLEKYSEAENVLEKIDLEKIKFDADYHFCLAAIAESKNKKSKALKHYKSAIQMRRYRAIYHLKYGKLLVEQGKKKEAEICLKWAAKIDANGKISEQATMLLDEIGNNK